MKVKQFNLPGYELLPKAPDDRKEMLSVAAMQAAMCPRDEAPEYRLYRHLIRMCPGAHVHVTVKEE